MLGSLGPILSIQSFLGVHELKQWSQIRTVSSFLSHEPARSDTLKCLKSALLAPLARTLDSAPLNGAPHLSGLACTCRPVRLENPRVGISKSAAIVVMKGAHTEGSSNSPWGALPRSSAHSFQSNDAQPQFPTPGGTAT